MFQAIMRRFLPRFTLKFVAKALFVIMCVMFLAPLIAYRLDFQSDNSQHAMDSRNDDVRAPVFHNNFFLPLTCSTSHISNNS